MKQETISKAKAAQLFAENAVLFGRADGVPEQVATELFGSAAVDFAKRQQNAGILLRACGSAKSLPDGKRTNKERPAQE